MIAFFSSALDKFIIRRLLKFSQSRVCEHPPLASIQFFRVRFNDRRSFVHRLPPQTPPMPTAPVTRSGLRTSLTAIYHSRIVCLRNPNFENSGQNTGQNMGYEPKIRPKAKNVATQILGQISGCGPKFRVHAVI